MKKLACLLLLIVHTIAIAQTQTVGLIQHLSGSKDDGYLLFAPIFNNTTFLIDKCGKQVHKWTSNYRPGQAVYLLENGNLLRTGNAMNSIFNAGGTGGVIENINWDGNVTWKFFISDTSQCQHHDIKQLPNGNIMAIVWEKKTIAEADAAGRNPSLIGNSLWSEKIVELKPGTNNTATIVWEWHAWDHLVQDFDNTKSNYAAIAIHPELINLNYKATNQNDWLHCNSIDYNPSLDQILLSNHNFGEIWIIDHSTSKAEAASHTGGKSGKGGDLLYRWGNPAAYNKGTGSDQKLFGQHNAHWIESGLPFANQIMIFDNSHGFPNVSNYSSIEIINPPLNVNGVYDSTLPYGPNSTTWSYVAPTPTDFYAQNISGAQQLSNGNVLICSGPQGYFFEINIAKNKVWEYINPVMQSGIAQQGQTPTQNSVFRCSFYPSNYSGFNGHTLVAGQPIEQNPQPYNCSLSAISNQLKNEPEILVYPNPCQDKLTISALQNDHKTLNLRLINTLGETIETSDNINLLVPYSIAISNLPNGIYLLQLDGKNYHHTEKINIIK